MIGIGYLWHVKVGDLYFRAVKNKVKMPARAPAGERWRAMFVGVDQTGGGQKHFYFAFTPQRIKIAGHDMGLFDPLNQGIKTAQLVMANTGAQGQVNQKNNHVFQFQLDDQALHAPFEIVKLLLMNGVSGQNGIALAIDDGHVLRQGSVIVFGFVDMIVTQGIGYGFGLILSLRTVGAGINLHQPNQIGIVLAEKVDNDIQVLFCIAQIAFPRHHAFAAGSVSDVVQYKSHETPYYHSRSKQPKHTAKTS